ncbi:putative modification methylase [uncultured Caudovirales phage]|uniref:Cytosine-specific methyltransferase n=1 Tax=uncultured Caudovirales phage TaxID=2100421 RepID=A0A2H4J169_9CAUD|nr:putative modification methylase [uncultured Caudovirales phage]
MTKFTYASAFAGIGGMTLGLKPLGGEGVIAWEYDPTEKRRQYAQDAHKLLHPEIPVHGDICEAQTDELPDFDLLCFTPPCQSYSAAGKRKGANFICTSCDTVFVPEVSVYEHLMTECKSCGSVAVPEDDRGVLTYQAIRIAKAKRPKALFMENVKGLVNHDTGNTLKAILQSINEIGYTVDFTVLNSKYFDVAQNRERVYLIAVRDDLIMPEQWNDVKGTTMLPKAKRRYQEEGAKTFNFDWPEQTEVRTRLRDFLEENVDERYYLSEDKTAALVAQLEAKVTESKQGIEYSRQIGIGKTREIAGCISSSDWRGLNRNQTQTAVAEIEGLPIREATKTGYTVAAVGDAVNIQFPNSKTRRGRVGKKMANTLEASGINQGVVERVGNVNPSGNGMNGNVYSIDAGLSPTLTTNKGEGVKVLEDSPIMLGHIDLKGHDAIKRVYSPTGQGPTLTTMGGGHREPKIAEEGPKYRIRKLTPRECLRLQSVPEDAIDALSTQFSDSRLYKFAGNGLTTNVITAIGERLIKHL